MRYVVNFSGGLCSWMAARRIVELHGPSNVTLLFADTLIEDVDLYRFLVQAACDLGCSLTPIKDGRTPWQVFRDERFLGNSRVDPCSKILKRALLDRWRSEHGSPEDTTIVIGLSWDEGDRLNRFRARVAPWPVVAPLYDPPYLTKNDLMDACRARGFEPPSLSLEGFPHNNCGGGCVKAGQAQFTKLYKVRPSTFATWEREEQAMRDYLGKDVSILRDRRNGGAPLTLAELRRRIEDQPEQIDMTEWGGCGCAIE